MKVHLSKEEVQSVLVNHIIDRLDVEEGELDNVIVKDFYTFDFECDLLFKKESWENIIVSKTIDPNSLESRN